jgi:hypothetical protein
MEIEEKVKSSLGESYVVNPWGSLIESATKFLGCGHNPAWCTGFTNDARHPNGIELILTLVDLQQ